MRPTLRDTTHRPSIAVLTVACTFALAAPSLAQTGAPEQVDSVRTESGPVLVESLASGLDHPWGMAFLPDGRLLVTERAGRLRILAQDGELSGPLAGVPDVLARDQGGLLDVALHPDFGANQWVYLSYARPGPGGAAATALGRGRLEGDGLADFEVLFTQEPWIDGARHFGGRIVFTEDGHLFLTLGERFQFDPAQDLSDHLGAIVRLNPDGTVPAGNPFVGQTGAEDEIWSYGHRNIESAALHPETGELWVAEMGPRGGDELNRIEAGQNHGWPEVSSGRHYDGESIPGPPTRPEFADAVKQWTPVISPSGMTAYTSDVFETWRGNFLIGSLSQQGLVRLEVQDGAVTGEEFIPLSARIRDVEQAPDGTLFVLTDQDDGDVWRLRPAG